MPLAITGAIVLLALVAAVSAHIALELGPLPSFIVRGLHNDEEVAAFLAGDRDHDSHEHDGPLTTTPCTGVYLGGQFAVFPDTPTCDPQSLRYAAFFDGDDGAGANGGGGNRVTDTGTASARLFQLGTAVPLRDDPFMTLRRLQRIANTSANTAPAGGVGEEAQNGGLDSPHLEVRDARVLGVMGLPVGLPVERSLLHTPTAWSEARTHVANECSQFLRNPNATQCGAAAQTRCFQRLETLRLHAELQTRRTHRTFVGFELRGVTPVWHELTSATAERDAIADASSSVLREFRHSDGRRYQGLVFLRHCTPARLTSVPPSCSLELHQLPAAEGWAGSGAWWTLAAPLVISHQIVSQPNPTGGFTYPQAITSAASCPSGYIMLGGTCSTNDDTDQWNFRLSQSRPLNGLTWYCQADNDLAYTDQCATQCGAVTITAQANCLNPLILSADTLVSPISAQHLPALASVARYVQPRHTDGTQSTEGDERTQRAVDRFLVQHRSQAYVPDSGAWVVVVGMFDASAITDTSYNTLAMSCPSSTTALTAGLGMTPGSATTNNRFTGTYTVRLNAQSASIYVGADCYFPDDCFGSPWLPAPFIGFLLCGSLYAVSPAPTAPAFQGSSSATNCPIATVLAGASCSADFNGWVDVPNRLSRMDFCSAPEGDYSYYCSLRVDAAGSTPLDPAGTDIVCLG